MGPAACTVCGKPVKVASRRPRLYCGRACQSKEFRRRRAAERDRLLAAATSTRAEDPQTLPVGAPDPEAHGGVVDVAQADDVDALDDTDDGDGDQGEPTQREVVEILSRQLARCSDIYFRELDEDGVDPDLALRHLTHSTSVAVSRLFRAARRVRVQEHPFATVGDLMHEMEEFAQLVAFNDVASLPGVHLAQHAGSGPELPDAVPPVDPAGRWGRPQLSMPLVENGLWEHWDVAGWQRHPEVVQVRHRRLVAGRAELVGTRWLAVAGSQYLREGTGASTAHRLRWFPTAQHAATALARRHQELWSGRDQDAVAPAR
jgi:hypothetical protein